MLELAINAVSLDVGGGLTGLLGYLRAWKEIQADLQITVYASRTKVLDSVREVRPDARVVGFCVGAPWYRRGLPQQLVLGRRIEESGARLVMTTNFLVERCRLPQLVHHRNLLMFDHPSIWPSLRHSVKLLLATRAARRALGGSSLNVFISDYLRQQAEKRSPRSRPRNVVLHNGLADSVIAAAERPSLFEGRPDLVLVTSEEQHKDNPTAIRTLAELVSRRGDLPWTLAVAGRGEYPIERALARELGVADRVRWLGFVEEDALDRRLRSAWCLIFPSRVEGFGNPPLEAMARRCPVVAAAATAIPEVCGDAALLVEPGREAAFAEAVLRLGEEPGLRESLVERGVGRVREFRWTHSAGEMFERMLKLAQEGTECNA